MKSFIQNLSARIENWILFILCMVFNFFYTSWIESSLNTVLLATLILYYAGKFMAAFSPAMLYNVRCNKERYQSGHGLIGFIWILELMVSPLILFSTGLITDHGWFTGIVIFFLVFTFGFNLWIDSRSESAVKPDVSTGRDYYSAVSRLFLYSAELFCLMQIYDFAFTMYEIIPDGEILLSLFSTLAIGGLLFIPLAAFGKFRHFLTEHSWHDNLMTDKFVIIFSNLVTLVITGRHFGGS